MVDVSDLVGLPYIPEVNDCLQSSRRYYAKIGIDIRDYAFPSDFWDHGADLYREFYAKEGFVSIDTDVWKPQLHDAMLVQGSLVSPFPTHVGILVEPNKVLHHFTNRLSELTAFKGQWRNPALVLRHKSVKTEDRSNLPIDLTDLMPAHVRRRLAGNPL